MIPMMPVNSRRDARSLSGFTRPEMLASTEWLAEQLARRETRVLDVRWRPDGSGRSAFLTGHIPGAVHLDWSTELIDRDEATPSFLLAGPAQVAGALGRAGIGDGASVVIYDDTLSLYAARAWWSLRVYGLESARILDGGFPGWVEEGREVSNADIAPVPSSFTPRTQPRMRLTTADVRGLVGSGRVTLLDARAPAEYRGLEGNTRRLGHIPGAVNLPVAGMTVPGTQRLKGGDELRALTYKSNVARGQRLVCYDGSGIAAAKLAFVLALLGHDDVAVYDGGWAEWGDRLDLPVER
jgi:thiosulfate/3-mercaptopyruvate sulfurtransferase